MQMKKAVKLITKSLRSPSSLLRGTAPSSPSRRRKGWLAPRGANSRYPGIAS